MEQPPADRATAQSPPTRVPARLALLILILVAECVALRACFDVRALKYGTGWWGSLLAGPSALARVAIAFIGVVLVLGGQRLPAIARDFRSQADRHQRWLSWFVLHLAGFAATFAFAVHVARGPVETGEPQTAITVTGTLLAGAALVFWLASIAAPEYWLRLLYAERTVVLSGCAIAAAAWYLGEWTQDAWGPLNEWTFSLVARILHLVYPEVVVIPEQRVIGPPQFLITIGADCSGYEGIGLICVFLTAFFWTFRQRLRFPQAWLLWPVGIVGIWLCNSVRIAVLVMIGTHYSQGVAIRGFHSQAGWLFFNLMALGLMFTALRLPFFVRQSATTSARARATPVDAYLLPLLVLVAMNMLVASLSDGFDRLYPLKVVVSAAVLWRYRATYRTLAWSWSWGALLNGIVVFAVWITLSHVTPHEDSEIPLSLDQLAPSEAIAWQVFRTAGSTLTVPLVEELAFRGYLLRRLTSADFDEVAYERTPMWAVVVSSLLFGLMHGRWAAGTFAGLCYAYATRRRGKLCDAVLAHAATNALIAADVFLAGAWWLW